MANRNATHEKRIRVRRGLHSKTLNFSCTTANFELGYVINEDIVRVLVNAQLIFYD